MTFGDRRLATIVVIDVVGYSRMMAEDEDATLATLRAHRNEIGPIVLNHGGRLVKSTGDGFLLEFPSAVSAVEASLAVQALMEHRNGELPPSRRMELRIGVNLGDVVVDETGDVFGDGVNVAARIEALAEPGGVALSDAVASAIAGRTSLELADGGVHELKNIPRPVRIWRVGGADPPVGPDRSTPRTTRKLATVAVLPFDNLSGDPDQEYFSDGITEDLITALSRDRDIAVVARNSTFAFKGSPTDVRTIARELDATHIVEGSVRKAGDRVRITAQLIDAETGHHQWAERYDRQLDDIFEVQDEVVDAIVTRIRPAFWTPSGNRSATESATFDAWDLTMRGNHRAEANTIEGFLDAIEYYDRAREIDPRFVPAIVRSAGVWFALGAFGWRSAAVKPFEPGRRDLELALSLEPDDHYVLCVKGAYSGVVEHRPDEGVAACRRAVEINPHAPFGFHMLGTNLDKTGDHEGAIESLSEAWRLGRHYSFRFDIAMDLGYAHYMSGNYDAAFQWGRQSIQLLDSFLQSRLLMAATVARLGMIDEAAEHTARVLETKPDFSCSRFEERFGYTDQEDRSRFVEGLRLAGLPG